MSKGNYAREEGRPVGYAEINAYTPSIERLADAAKKLNTDPQIIAIYFSPWVIQRNGVLVAQDVCQQEAEAFVKAVNETPAASIDELMAKLLPQNRNV